MSTPGLLCHHGLTTERLDRLLLLLLLRAHRQHLRGDVLVV